MERETEGARERARGAREAWEGERRLGLLDRANRDRAVGERKRCERLIVTQVERYKEYSRRAEEYRRVVVRLRARAENAAAVGDVVQERLDQDERDLNVMAEYEVEDEQLLKALELDLSRASQEMHRRKLDAEDAKSHRAALHGELQRVSKNLSDVHARQMELSDELSRAKCTLAVRSRLIKRTLHAKNQISAELEEKQACVRELNEASKRIDMLNKGSQSKITLKEKVLRHKNEKCQELRRNLASLTQALETASHIRTSSIRGAEGAKARRCEAEETLKTHVELRDEKFRRVQKAEKMLEEERSSLMTLEECLQRLQRAHDADAATLQSALHDLEADKEQHFAVTKALHEQKQSNCRLEMELNGAMVQSKNLREKEHSLQTKIMKQQESIYSTSLQLQQLERKAARLQGVRSAEEKEKLEALIGSLQVDLDETRREYVEVAAEVKENELKLERVRVETNKRSEETNAASSVKQLLEVDAEGCKRQEHETLDRMETLQVELDKLRLKIAQRHRVLFLSCGQAKEITKRKAKISSDLLDQRDMLKGEHASNLARGIALQQQGHAAIMKVRNLEQRLDHLRSRYDIVRAKSPYGEELEINQQEDCLIIIENQREELDRERDDLNELIACATRDVESMRAILEDAERSNSNLRASLSHAHEIDGASHEEWKTAEALLERLQVENDGLALLREREDELTEALEKIKQHLEVAVDEYNALSSDVHNAERAHDSALRKYKSQKAKLRRSRRIAESAIALHRDALSLTPEDPPTTVELRVRARQLTEAIRKASEIVRSSSSTQAFKPLADSLGDSVALSPTSSLTSFFTFASSATRSSVSGSIASSSRSTSPLASTRSRVTAFIAS